MKKYTDEQVDILRKTSMRDILAAEGRDTSHTRGGLYFSPFREKERTPSFHIDDTNHRFFDHGDPNLGRSLTGKARGGGDVIVFVRLLLGCSFLEACDYLCRYNPTVVPNKTVAKMEIPQREDRILSDGSRSGEYLGTEIRDARVPFCDAALIAMAEGRGIPKDILERYCREVYYGMRYREGSGERTIYRHAIGFPNSDGGWVLRYIPRREGDKGKRSTGGHATYLGPDGAVIPSDAAVPIAGNVIVFEGFMDFLSWIADKRPGGTPKDTDITVLNSVANLSDAAAFITAHRNVLGLLDGDKTGDVTTKELAGICRTAGVRFYDCRFQMDGYKDYNEYWQARLKPAVAG